MLRLLGVPLVEWNMKRFREFGVSEFFINLHYLPEVLRSYLGDGSRLGVRIHYHFEPQLLGTAGGIKSFEDQLDEEFFLIYGDIFSNVDYGAMEDDWRQKPKAMGMQTMTLTTDYADADVAELDREGRVLAVHPKPHTSDYANAYRMRGAFILRRKLLAEVPAAQYFEIGKHLIPAVIAKGGSFYGYAHCDYSRGIDTFEKWKEVEDYMRSNGFAGKSENIETH
jgi:NDP-sugar pyrophosphorylase family protein